MDRRIRTFRETELMAECMDMVRNDLIQMGIIDKGVPPMMVPEAVCAAMQKAVAAEREACALLAEQKAARMGQEADEAEAEGSTDTATSNKASAWLLSVTAAAIRARAAKSEKS